MALVHTRGFDPAVFDESPWYAPFATLTDALRHGSRFPTTAELSALYARRVAGSDARPLTFVTAAPKKKKTRREKREPIVLGALYEGRIVEAGEVPTRENDWHDLFNALAFCAFPRAKWALHARQYGVYRSRIAPGDTRLPGARTREQDALALFDEGGLVVCVAGPVSLPDDVNAVDGELTRWIRAGAARALPFGHALYEHLAAGLAPPLAYAHVLSLDGLPEPGALSFAELDRIDRALMRSLEDPAQFSAPHAARGLSLAALVD